MSPRARTKRIPPPTAPVNGDGGDDVELANLDAHLPPGYTVMTPTEERREVEVEEIASELGSDGRIKVWHIIDGKSSYAGEMSAAEFTLETLLDAFGGGDKSLSLMQGKVKRDTYRVSLDPSVPPKSPRTLKAVQAAAGIVPSQNTDMMALMMKSSMDSANAINQMMTGMIGALTAMMTATKPTSDPTETALKIITAVKGNGGNATVSDQMAMFREGLQLAERFADKDDGDGTTQIIAKGMETLATLVDGIVSANKAKQNPVAVIPAPTDPIPPQVEHSNGVEPVSVRPWVDAARPHIAALLKASSFMKPPSAALAISEMLTDEQFDDLITDIEDQENGGFGARFTQYFPDVEGINAEWFGQVIHTLLTEYVEADGADAST